MKSLRIISVLIFFMFTPSIFANQLLVDANWLVKHKNDKNVVVVDMSSDYTQHQRFHIPGAVYLPYSEINQTSKQRISYAVSPQLLQRNLGALGINQDTHIVIYDDMGGLNASRLFWQLEQIGHKKVSILDGGLVSWIRKGLPITGQVVQPKPASYTAKKVNMDNLASMQDVLKASKGNSITLVDARSTEEYLGHPRYKRSGHIPGAISYSWDNSVDFNKAFMLKSKKQIKSLLKQAGLKSDKNKPIIAYCRSGHRAAHAYFNLRLLGYKNIKLYDGSIAEYERQVSAPLKTGKQP